MEKLIEGKCEACKADAPLVTPEERKTLMPQIPGWDVIEVDGIEQLTCLAKNKRNKKRKVKYFC